MADHAQEFAESIAEECFDRHDSYKYAGGKEGLVYLIASELRENGWIRREGWSREDP